jgi:hypothetical protein
VLSRAVNHRANTLQIWVPAAAARVIGMANHIAKTRSFAAQLTSHRHNYSSPQLQNSHKAESLAKFLRSRTLFVDWVVGCFEFKTAHYRRLRRNEVVD